MLSTASALVFVEKRRLVEVIPDSIIRFLDEWQVRVLIVVSLILQIILITLGKRRKYICKIWVRIIIWCAYLMADWVAVVALGIISKDTIDEYKTAKGAQELMCFWAQFFLLHLGGPDTITAYSLEDNELWLRHLVALVVQTGVAFYILLAALPGSSWLPVLSILVFIAGLIKYVERLCALSAANSENFRDSMLTKPDAGPNYAKFMEEFTLKKAEGFHVKVEIPVPPQRSDPKDIGEEITEAYNLFLTFKCLFADAILSFQDRDSSRHYFLQEPSMPSTKAFYVVEVELGLVFDELYTKASIVYKVRGFVLRMVTFSFTLLALMAFLFLAEKSECKKTDLIITYLLLGVAICLEIYALWVVINSDWTHNWLSRHERITLLSRMIQWFQQGSKRKRWSKKMAQHNLLDLCVGDNGAGYLRVKKFLWGIPKLIRMDNYLEAHWYMTFVDVSEKLKDLIFGEIKCDHFTLENSGHISPDWTKEKEFHQKILLLHIATDICYTLDNEHHLSSDIAEMKQAADNSKHISDYMLYLLIACPFMLPIGFGMIGFRDTCAEVKEFLEDRNVKTSKVEACKKLLEVNTEVPPGKVKGDRSKSVLFDACRLAKPLLARKEDKWEIISKEWVKMLASAATHCRGNHHARQLRKGGELLTHVWFLMAHLGITEQLQISQGHARAKLIVK